MALKGSLEDINIADVMQLIASSGKTGRFRLLRNQGEGFIYFLDGSLVHAEYAEENLKGESAIYRLAAWKNGTFEFEQGCVTEETTIRRSFTTVLMEAVRIVDEWELIRKKIPSEDVIPYFLSVSTDDKRMITLNTMEWLILSKIDGHKSIKKIAFEAGLSIFEVAKVFYGLVVNQLISIRSSPEA